MALTDLFTFNGEIDIADGLTLSSLTSYNENHDDRRGDSTGGFPTVTFPISAALPTGIATSGQFGTADRLLYESSALHGQQAVQRGASAAVLV